MSGWDQIRNTVCRGGRIHRLFAGSQSGTRQQVTWSRGPMRARFWLGSYNSSRHYEQLGSGGSSHQAAKLLSPCFTDRILRTHVVADRKQPILRKTTRLLKVTRTKCILFSKEYCIAPQWIPWNNSSVVALKSTLMLPRSLQSLGYFHEMDQINHEQIRTILPLHLLIIRPLNRTIERLSKIIDDIDKY